MRLVSKESYVVVPPPPSPTAPEMRRIARKWELFVTGADVDLSDVPPIIREAWIRSKQAGVDPALPRAPWQEIPNDPEVLREEIDWFSCAEKVLSLLSNYFTEPHQLVSLVDQQGRLLSIRGGRRAMARAEQIYAIPGGEWGEQKAGCNSLGTSVYTGLPVQICWQENYIANVQDWTSQAAPIHGPTTGEVLGAVGLAGHDKLAHPRAFELVIQAATMIEGAIREQETTARLAILERFAQLVAHYPADGLLALDKRGRILSVNPAMEKMLSLSPSRLIGQSLQKIPKLQQLGALNTAASIQQLLSHEPAPGVTFFPVPLDRATGAILLLSQPTRTAVPKRQSEQSWTTTYTFTDLLGQSPLFRQCMARAHKASQYDWPVLLLGESGTGKELVAQSIHSASSRRHGPFVPLDCAGVSDDLIGMELFGYEEGAFTGAAKGGKPGKIQLAHGGTLFLDDVDNLPAKVQVSLLRVLETGQVVPIGGSKPRPINMRVIAASNGNLEQLVGEGKFRHDLYHRLNVLSLQVPPLRECREGIEALARHFIDRAARQIGCRLPALSPPALARLAAYHWPGNVRQLENVLFQAVSLCEGETIEPAHLRLPDVGDSAGLAGIDLEGSLAGILGEVERRVLEELYPRHPSSRQLAKRLGVSHTTIANKLRRHGIGGEG